MNNLIAKQEIITAFYKEKELVAFILKNGNTEFFETKKMTYGHIAELFSANLPENHKV